MAEVEKYPNGEEIKRFPRWVYPGDKPVVSGERRHTHNGVLVNNEKELKEALASFGEGEIEQPSKDNKKAGWNK